jgi:hypothetical protein
VLHIRNGHHALRRHGIRIYPGAPWSRHILAAMACFGLSGLLRLAEFFIAQGTGGVS